MVDRRDIEIARLDAVIERDEDRNQALEVCSKDFLKAMRTFDHELLELHREIVGWCDWVNNTL